MTEYLAPITLQTAGERIAGRIVTAGGITAGMEMGFHLLRRAGYGEDLLSEVARVMEYSAGYELYRDDRETTAGIAPVGVDSTGG